MDLSQSVKSNTQYKWTVANSVEFNYPLKNRFLEGMIENGAYFGLEKNYPIDNWEIRDNPDREDHKDLYFTTGDFKTMNVSVQELWNTFKSKGDSIGINLSLVNSKITAGGVPEYQDWWKKIFDDETWSEGISEGYEEIKFLLIIILLIYIFKTANDFLN